MKEKLKIYKLIELNIILEKVKLIIFDKRDVPTVGMDKLLTNLTQTENEPLDNNRYDSTVKTISISSETLLRLDEMKKYISQN